MKIEDECMVLMEASGEAQFRSQSINIEIIKTFEDQDMLLNEEMLKYIIYAIEGGDGFTCITLCHEVVVTQRAQFSSRNEQVMIEDN